MATLHYIWRQGPERLKSLRFVNELLLSREEWPSTQVLLDRGADIDARNDEDYTPLHSAAEAGKDEAVKVCRHTASPFTEEWPSTQVLLDRGADVDAANAYGWTPLHLAAWRGKVEIVKVCRHTPSPFTEEWPFDAGPPRQRRRHRCEE